jgi:hypothetical protein
MHTCCAIAQPAHEPHTPLEGCGAVARLRARDCGAHPAPAPLPQVSVRDPGGAWRDVAGADPLALTLGAAGVSAGATEAVRFRLAAAPGADADAAAAAAPAPRRRGQAGGGGGGKRRGGVLRAAIGAAVFLIKAALALEATAWAYQIAAGGARRRGRGGGGGGDGDGEGGGSDRDPADVLMAYLTGEKGADGLTPAGAQPAGV